VLELNFQFLSFVNLTLEPCISKKLAELDFDSLDKVVDLAYVYNFCYYGL